MLISWLVLSLSCEDTSGPEKRHFPLSGTLIFDSETLNVGEIDFKTNQVSTVIQGMFPTWRHGQEIIYVSNGWDDAYMKLNLLNASRYTTRKIFEVKYDSDFFIYYPSVSPNGQYAAFDDRKTGIRIVDITEGKVKYYIQNLFNPSWLPDGRLVACGSFRRPDIYRKLQTPSAEGIYVLDKSFSNPVRIDSLPTGSQPECVTVSDDGKMFAFVRDEDVWTMAADGSQARQVTTGPNKAENITWSPDGNWIAIVSYQDNLGYFAATVPSAPDKPVKILDYVLYDKDWKPVKPQYQMDWRKTD